MEEEILQRLARVEQWALLAAKKMLTIDDAAMLTGLSKSTLYKFTCLREIPHSKPNGKQIYFDRDDLEAWMRTNRVTTNQEAEAGAAGYCISHAMKGAAL